MPRENPDGSLTFADWREVLLWAAERLLTEEATDAALSALRRRFRLPLFLRPLEPLVWSRLDALLPEALLAGLRRLLERDAPPAAAIAISVAPRRP